MKYEDLQGENISDSGKDILKEATLCTSCGWCLDWCPVELDIPLFMSVSGELCFSSASVELTLIDTLPENKRPDACLTCWKCARMCPQNIPIPKVIRELNAQYIDKEENIREDN